MGTRLVNRGDGRKIDMTEAEIHKILQGGKAGVTVKVIHAELIDHHRILVESGNHIAVLPVEIMVGPYFAYPSDVFFGRDGIAHPDKAAIPDEQVTQGHGNGGCGAGLTKGLLLDGRMLDEGKRGEAGRLIFGR